MRNRLLYLVMITVIRLFAHLPIHLADWLGARCGELAYLCLARRRRIALDNLTLAFGAEKAVRERRRIAWATFRNLGRHMIDFSRLCHLTPDTFRQLCTVEGLEHVEALLARRTGLLMLSAHFGSWELSPALALRLSTPLHVITRPLASPALQRLVNAYRQRCGCQIIVKQQALPASLKALRRGEVVGMLIDQSSLWREGIPVTFFGAQAHTTTGPALLALRARCPVIGAFLVREGPGRHRLLLSPEIPVQRSGNIRRDIEENTRIFTQVVESYVRRYPDHWFWLHRRWKQRHAP